jgi:hypothetical protein
MMSLSTGVKRERPSASTHEEELATTDNNNNNTQQARNLCSFCQQVPAAVTVQVAVLHRKKRAAAPYCLACYYTTAAVRQDTEKYVSVSDPAQLDEQLPPMQQLFSEVYVELQQELSEESARAFQKQKSDPLAMLAPKRRMVKAPKPASHGQKKAGDAADGGFLRSIPLPERLKKTQQQQARLQQAQIARMNQSAALSSLSSTTSNVYQRRKSSRKSIWNLAMDPNAAQAIQESKEDDTAAVEDLPACSSCGSRNVKSFGNVTSRNQDMRKGETWGMKDRGDDVVTRCQCNQCGKIWNEAE